MHPQDSPIALPISDEERDKLIAFCESLLSIHQPYVNYKDHSYDANPANLFAIFKKNKEPKKILHEQEWYLYFQPPEGFDSLVIQKQFHPDANPQVIRYALLLNDAASLQYVWVWIQKPNEVKDNVPLFVYLTTAELGTVTDIATAQPILDKIVTALQAAAPLKL